jgi:hypothetical protein
VTELETRLRNRLKDALSMLRRLRDAANEGRDVPDDLDMEIEAELADRVP